ERSLWHTLWIAGQDLGLRPFGMRAMMSLRLDRFFGSWAREFSPDYFPGETGIDRFIRWNKDADWIGKAPALKEKAEGPKRRLCHFIVDADDADVVAYEPIWLDDNVVGFCTSGGYSHWTGKSVAMGFLPTDRIKDGLAVEIEILGQRRKAKLTTEVLWDPAATRMRT
ncbi:MAG: glycine cleavage system protein T, partial [Paracoccaceae bacterium]|nr:glycine cleavage system protein T [Paracoccaceae bacterium]